MEAFTYQGPDGEILPNPTFEVLCALLGAGPEYWDAGSGSAVLGWLERREGGYAVTWELNQRPTLHLLKYDADLIFLAYTCDRDGVDCMPYDALAPAEDFRWYVGGEPMYFPCQSLVTRSVAEPVIGDFLARRDLPRGVVWRERQFLGEGRYGYNNR